MGLGPTCTCGMHALACSKGALARGWGWGRHARVRGACGAACAASGGARQRQRACRRLGQQPRASDAGALVGWAARQPGCVEPQRSAHGGAVRCSRWEAAAAAVAKAAEGCSSTAAAAEAAPPASAAGQAGFPRQPDLPNFPSFQHTTTAPRSRDLSLYLPYAQLTYPLLHPPSTHPPPQTSTSAWCTTPRAALWCTASPRRRRATSSARCACACACPGPGPAPACAVHLVYAWLPAVERALPARMRALSQASINGGHEGARACRALLYLAGSAAGGLPSCTPAHLLTAAAARRCSARVCRCGAWRSARAASPTSARTTAAPSATRTPRSRWADAGAGVYHTHAGAA